MILTLDNGGKVSVVEQQVSLYLLFNPWSTGKSLGLQSCPGSVHLGEPFRVVSCWCIKMYSSFYGNVVCVFGLQLPTMFAIV